MRSYLAAMEVGFAAAQATLGDWIPLAVLGISLVTAGTFAIWEIRRRRKDAEFRAFCRFLAEEFYEDEAESLYDRVTWN